MKTARKVSDNLWLVTQTLTDTPVKAVPSPTEHVAIIDCSGSMAGDLPALRTQLKNKLPTMLKPGDTFSAIWFSGRGEYGLLLDRINVESLKSISGIQEAIDKWLRPVGMTGFLSPLECASKLITSASVSSARPAGNWSLLFMSDGCDNQNNRADILKVVDTLSRLVTSSIIVEYGYYADRSFLAAMAAKLGARHVFAEQFPDYATEFESAITSSSSLGPKQEVTIESDVVCNLAWSLDDATKAIVTYEVEAGKVLVPTGVDAVYFLSPTLGNYAPNGWEESSRAIEAVYAAKSIFANRAKPDVVLALLKTTGDVRMIDMFANCFGKQKYSEFQKASEEAAFSLGLRYVAGKDPNRIPAEDAFTLLDFLRILSSDEDNRVLLDSPAFEYSRIGRARVPNDDALKFESEKKTDGYSVRSLVFNEDRPNISINIRKEGKVDLTNEADRPKEVPTTFETAIYRNYTIVKDGLVNVKKLPVHLSFKTLDALKAAGFLPSSQAASAEAGMIIDLCALPLINRKMVKSLSAKTFFTAHYESMRAAAAQKVYGTYYKELVSSKDGFTRTSEGLVAKFGVGPTAWLKERGLTDQGFSPRGKTAVATDFYMGKELKVSLKGLSSLPSVKEAKEKLAKATDKKPAPIGARLMQPYIDEVETFLKANSGREAVIRGYLDGQQVTARTKARAAMAVAAQDMLCVVVGQTWFQEFATLEQNALTIDTPEGKIDCKVEMKEIEIKL